MNKNDVLFQKVTQAYLGKKSECSYQESNPESDTGILGKKIQVLLSGVEPKTFRLLVRMLYH